MRLSVLMGLFYTLTNCFVSARIIVFVFFRNLCLIENIKVLTETGSETARTAT